MRVIKFILIFMLSLLLVGCLTPLPFGNPTSSTSSPNSSTSPVSPSTSVTPPPAFESSSQPSLETSDQGSTATPSALPSQLEPKEVAQGTPGKNRIALTFDAGAGRGYIDQILETLVRNKVPATFFVTGAWAEDNPEDVKRISQLGFRIGNHTQTHPYLTGLSDEEIRNELHSLEQKVVELTGRSTRPLFRPPYGDRDERVLEIAASEGYWSIYWTIDSLDWQEGHDPQWVKERILSRLEDGAIILCHVASPYTYLVLDELIQSIREMGFTFVPIEEFLK
ncbi:MAG: polysaccharide deacetylase family protein [Coprothermobacterota bacterium]|nr:polysaccharide deacetylase family protein [Coprothermobacterota bacterium]